MNNQQQPNDLTYLQLPSHQTEANGTDNELICMQFQNLASTSSTLNPKGKRPRKTSTKTDLNTIDNENSHATLNHENPINFMGLWLNFLAWTRLEILISEFWSSYFRSEC